MVHAVILLIFAAIAPSLSTASVNRAAGSGLDHLELAQLTVARERSQAREERTGGSEAKNLAEYCEGGGEDEVEEEQHVLADWKGYGTYYPGVIESKHRDGSVDVLYDDGWLEQRVPKSGIKQIEPTVQNKKERDDAVCDCVEDVAGLKDKIKDANANVAVYLAGERAAATGKTSIPTEAAAPAPAAAEAAAAPAVMSDADGEQATYLQKLKEELSELDDAIADEEAMIESNDLKIKGLVEEAPHPVTRTKTVDDLIAEYSARIAERRETLEKLREERRKQEVQLAGMGKASTSLDKIQENTKDIAEDMDHLRAKRNKLEKEKRLDDELRAAVDGILAKGAKLNERIEALARAKQEADAKIKDAEKAAEEAERTRLAAAIAEAKRTAVEETGAKKDKSAQAAEDEAAARVAVAKKEAAEKAALEAQAKVFKAGEEVEKELKSVSKETETLDTGVHPHGDKWWRYRYEHSFIEAGLMICISALMLFYMKLLNWVRAEVYERSHLRASSGTMYTRWLEFTSLQMLACLVVFLTIWLLDHCGVFNLLATNFHGSKSTRLPDSGKQYKQLAFDICVVLIITFLLYFQLMFSVVHWSMINIRRWASSDEAGVPRPMPGAPSRFASTVQSSRRTPKIKKALTFYGTGDDFQVRKDYFLMHITSHPAILKKLQTGSNLGVDGLEQRFPFWKYLRMNVRAFTDELLELTTDLWFGIITTFVVLGLLHYCFHVGYIRVMVFFLFLQLSTLGICMYLVYNVNATVESQMNEDEETPGEKLPRDPTFIRDKSMAKASLGKRVVLFLMQYTLFFLCYGAARAICQPWMWKLHFWPVLAVVFFTVLLAGIFMTALAPLITTFAASMAMPPYLDTDNISHMEHVIDALEADTMTAQEYLRIGSRSPSEV